MNIYGAFVFIHPVEVNRLCTNTIDGVKLNTLVSKSEAARLSYDA